MNKYELAIHNLRMANIVHESNEKLYQENSNDLDVLEELIEKYDEAMKLGDDEITGYSLKIGYEVMRNKYNEMIAERDEALKRIEELESRCIGLEQYASQLKKENVSFSELDENIKELDLDTLIILEKKKVEEWCEREMTMLPPREMFDSILKFCETNKNLELLKKIKEMLGK